MIKVRVGGVPEHFNLAWHLAIQANLFDQKNIIIEWVNVPGGTGAMCKALRNDELDMAIALTEGVVSDIMLGNPSKIVQFYVNSPLRWGIYVNSKSNITTIDQMQGNKYAISRYKSGSHLMAYVNASNNNLTINESDFVVVDNLDGARKALQENTAQLFMWEKYTTKPYVDNGEFKMLGECSSPWPCFVVTATNNFIDNHALILNEILDIVNMSCIELKKNKNAPELVAKLYNIKEEDAFKWFNELEYANHSKMEDKQWIEILRELHKFGIIERIPVLAETIYTKNLAYV